jgi:hypothetical protein
MIFVILEQSKLGHSDNFIKSFLTINFYITPIILLTMDIIFTRMEKGEFHYRLEEFHSTTLNKHT